MKIKVEPFLMKKGNRIAKAAIEFEESDSFLAGFHLVGFTICDDTEKGLFVLFPASIVKAMANNLGTTKADTKTFFFLRPSNENQLEKLETLILDRYDEMMKFNTPVIKDKV